MQVTWNWTNKQVNISRKICTGWPWCLEEGMTQLEGVCGMSSRSFRELIPIIQVDKEKIWRIKMTPERTSRSSVWPECGMHLGKWHDEQFKSWTEARSWTSQFIRTCELHGVRPGNTPEVRQLADGHEEVADWAFWSDIQGLSYCHCLLRSYWCLWLLMAFFALNNMINHKRWECIELDLLNGEDEFYLDNYSTQNLLVNITVSLAFIVKKKFYPLKQSHIVWNDHVFLLHVWDNL